jgi:type I restriction enzyme, S subunit
LSMENLITDHIETWTTAKVRKTSGGRGRNKKSNGKNQYGIKKLKELILDLAVKGKLVPQNPNDEPAKELLKKCVQENSKSLQSKKINPRTILFDVPGGWLWERFGNIAVIERGGSPRPIKSFLTEDADGFNWIKIGDTEQGGKYITSTHEKIISEGLAKTRMVYPGDFLLTNSMSFGRPYITKIEGCIHDGWLRISPPSIIEKDYLYHLLSSTFVFRQFQSAAAGAVVMNLNADKVRELAIPIPPLDEQHRIVTKVDELMTLCDLLEQEQTDNSETHQLLVKTLLDSLASSTDHDDFIESWQRIEDNFDILFTTPESIDELKQTILQLAVIGKLLPQDPNDEPASKLLEKIVKEKDRLVKEGKIKKQRPLPEISADEKPFELPLGWGWSRLGNISANVHYGYTASANQGIQDVRLLRITDIQDSKVDWQAVPGCEIQAKSISDYQLQDGDILIARTGGTIGKSYLVKNINVCSVFASYLIRVQRIDEMYPDYIKTYLGSHLYWEQLYEQSMGTGQPNVNGNALKRLRVPLPPLNEQHRIVTKVNQLIILCDLLKDQLENAQATQIQLADAIVINKC